MGRNKEIENKIYNWAKKLCEIIDEIDKSTSSQIIANQLFRSGTSIAANYAESQSASSRKDFINFLHYSLKSANESKFWLGLLGDMNKLKSEEIDNMQDELDQIAKILGASLLTLKGIKRKSEI